MSKRDLIRAFNSGYMLGHHDTVEAQFTDICRADMATYHEDVIDELLADGEIKNAEPDLIGALQEILDTPWLGGKGGFHRARAAIAKATAQP
jgi:hypothetical protein